MRDFNGETTYGVGSYQLSIGKRWRESAAVAFLRPAMARPNLTVVTGAHATRIRFEGKRAVGVEWVSRAATHPARAEREVILSAGALQSPQLLQLSGIGRPACCASTASRSSPTCRASARTCRTTTRPAPSSA